MLLEPIEVIPAKDVGGVHFIAIGGSGMSGVAKLYHDLGVPTSGSDQIDSAYLRKLAKVGVQTYVGHAAEQLGDAQTVVISSAIRETNPELAEARRRGLRVWHRSAALAALMAGRRCVAIAGTHGKTTTTAMTAVMLEAAGVDPSYVIGGPLSTTGLSSHLGSGEAFVIEADESDGSFLQYPTEVAVITNVEADHLVNWGTPEAYAAGFRRFATQPHVSAVVINVDDPGSRSLAERLRSDGANVVSYGEADDADVRFSDVRVQGATNVATLTYGEDVGELRLQVPGNHNLANASAAYAAGRLLGLGHQQALDALATFEGTLRRFQLVTQAAGVRVYDDYAHHPTEIRAALSAARRATQAGNDANGLDGRLVAVFQPHLYSRTIDFCAEFGEVLTAADVAVVTNVDGAREDPVPGVTGELVVAAARDAGAPEVHYVAEKYDLPEWLDEFSRPGDLIITLGCGDITIVGPILAKLLQAKDPS